MGSSRLLREIYTSSNEKLKERRALNMFEKTGINKYDVGNIITVVISLAAGAAGIYYGFKGNQLRCEHWRNEYSKFVPPTQPKA